MFSHDSAKVKFVMLTDCTKHASRGPRGFLHKQRVVPTDINLWSLGETSSVSLNSGETQTCNTVLSYFSVARQ